VEVKLLVKYVRGGIAGAMPEAFHEKPISVDDVDGTPMDNDNEDDHNRTKDDVLSFAY
jgi:cytochrome d ubiquinol oxidase subunit I